MTNPLDYKDNSLLMPEDCIFKISPSKFSKFINQHYNWFRSEVLGESDFTHNTSSVIGTVVHYCAEKVAKQEDVNKKDIEEYINSWEPKYGRIDDFDPEIAKDNYLAMAECLVNDYVLENDFLSVEQFVHAPIKEGFYVGGTIDRLEGNIQDTMIVDYKTYNSKTKPKAMPIDYKYQLLVYAFILKHLGYNVTRIRTVHINRNIEGEISEKTGKRLKSYPPEVTVLTETITEQDFEFITSQLELCVDTCLAWDKYPELQHVIWHDPRLLVKD